MSDVKFIKGMTEEDINKVEHVFRVYDQRDLNMPQERKDKILGLFDDLIKFEAPLQTPGFGELTCTKKVLPFEMYLQRNSMIVTKENKENPDDIFAIAIMTILQQADTLFAHVTYTWVPEEHRGKKHGLLLLEAIENVAKERFGCKMLHLSVLPNNVNALEFYKKNDFKPYMINMSKVL